MTRGPYGGPWRRVRLQILERDGWLCQIRSKGCTTKATQVDHIVPWRLGGAWYDPSNLRGACANCNKARANKDRVYSPSRLA